MSRDNDNSDYKSANEALIKRETQKFERAKAKAESLESSMSKGIAAAIREQRQKLRAEASQAVNKGEAGNLSDNERRMLDAAQKGIDNVRIDEGIVTGYDVPDYLRNRHDDDDF